MSSNITAQNNVSGRVLDKDQKPIAGAYVQHLQTRNFAITDTAGYYSITAPEGDSIVISAMGYGIEVVISRWGLPVVSQLKRISFELDEVIVYEFKDWEAFKKDFLDLDIPEQKVNVQGLPNSTKVNPIPIKYRSNQFPRKPPAIAYVISPISSLNYAFSNDEKQKRTVMKQINREKRERVYRSIVRQEVIAELIPIPDSLIVDFIVYCHMNIDNKRLSDEYEYKEKIGLLWKKFQDEHKTFEKAE